MTSANFVNRRNVIYRGPNRYGFLQGKEYDIKICTLSSEEKRQLGGIAYRVILELNPFNKLSIIYTSKDSMKDEWLL